MFGYLLPSTTYASLFPPYNIPKAIAEAIKEIPAPDSLELSIEFIAKIIPKMATKIRPVVATSVGEFMHQIQQIFSLKVVVF